MKFYEDIPDEIVMDIQSGIGRVSLHKKYGISQQTARHYIALVKNNKNNKPISNTKIKTTHTDKEMSIEVNGFTIKTLDEALKAANVDTDTYSVDRYVINSWQVTMKIDDKPVTKTNYQIKVWLKPIVINPVEVALKGLITQLPKHEPVYCTTIGTPDGNYLLEVGLNDIHFGMLAWDKETGTDWDIKLAEKIFVDTVKKILERVEHFKISRILFPIGNDFFHLNSPDGLTPSAHNRLDYDSRLAKIYQAGKMAVFKAIEYCLGVASVDIIWVPGNHDPETSYFLVDALKEHYSNIDNVTVDISPKVRKYYQWGNCMIGMTHGNEEPHRDLPTIMAAEEPEIWSQTKFREWHVGHFHKKKQTNYIAGDTFGGVVVRVLPSICGTDSWHYKKGYIHPFRTGEAIIWDKNEGNIGTIAVNILN